MSIANAISALQPILDDRLSLSVSDRQLHGQSESYFPNTPPDAIAYPTSTKEVAQIVEICAEHGCPVVAWGTGTSLEAQAQAVNGGLCVDFSRMSSVIDIRAEDMIARVQPGITREALNIELRATGLFFPVDPGANASIGGMASTRASGTTAVRYGTMRDNVIGLEVVLADGRIIRTGTEARKSSAGYDLTSLFVGAEGTLGLITELTLRLHGQPEAISSGICAFAAMEDAVNAVIEVIQSGIPMARIEFLDASTVAAFNAYAGVSMALMPHLLVEFHGSPAEVAAQSTAFGEIVKSHNSQGFEWATDPEDRARLWKMRHNGYYAILASKPGARAIVTDICVPISRLAEAVDQTRADIAQSGLSGPILGHVGDGNFHAILLIDPDSPTDLATAKALSHRMVERSLALGGTSTGEHGVGIGKLPYMAQEHGGAWDVMAQIKSALDPANIMNPSKLVQVKVTENP